MLWLSLIFGAIVGLSLGLTGGGGVGTGAGPLFLTGGRALRSSPVESPELVAAALVPPAERSLSITLTDLRAVCRNQTVRSTLPDSAERCTIPTISSSALSNRSVQTGSPVISSPRSS